MDDPEGGVEFSDGDGGPCSSMSGATCAVCMGFLFFPAALFLLGWNENGYACEDRRILHSESHAAAASCDRNSLSGDGFVFFSCQLVPSSLTTFKPCSFNTGVPCNNLISFRSVSARQVAEMYVCVQECKTERSTTAKHAKVKKCSYSMQWTSSAGRNDFSGSADKVAEGCPDFHLAGGNPAPPVQLGDLGTMDRYAEKVLAGSSESAAYTLNSGLIHQLQPDSRLSLLPYAGNFTGATRTGFSAGLPWKQNFSFSLSSLHVSENYLVSCSAPYRLGCVRISYFTSASTSPSVLSHVTRSTGQTSPEMVDGSWGCGAQQWQAILPERYDKVGMIEVLREQNRLQVWVFRFVGLCLAWVAIYCCFQPLAAGAQALGGCVGLCPCGGGLLEELLEGVVTAVLCVMSCSIGCSTGLVVIAAVWLFMRPLIGVLLLLVAAGFCGLAAAARMAYGSSQEAKAEPMAQQEVAQGFVVPE